MSRRRNIDNDAVPASSGTAPWSMDSYNETIKSMQARTRNQIDRMAKLATFADQMERHLTQHWLELQDGDASDRKRGERVLKLLDEYKRWKESDR